MYSLKGLSDGGVTLNKSAGNPPSEIETAGIAELTVILLGKISVMSDDWTIVDSLNLDVGVRAAKKVKADDGWLVGYNHVQTV